MHGDEVTRFPLLFIPLLFSVISLLGNAYIVRLYSRIKPPFGFLSLVMWQTVADGLADFSFVVLSVGNSEVLSYLQLTSKLRIHDY